MESIREVVQEAAARYPPAGLPVIPLRDSAAKAGGVRPWPPSPGPWPTAVTDSGSDPTRACIPRVASPGSTSEQRTIPLKQPDRSVRGPSPLEIFHAKLPAILDGEPPPLAPGAAVGPPVPHGRFAVRPPHRGRILRPVVRGPVAVLPGAPRGQLR